MTARGNVYKCEMCGNITELLHVGGGTLSCCGQPMKLQEENTTDAAQEKHVPVLQAGGAGMTVKVGSVAHPMDDNHYIEWIEVNDGGKTDRRFLNPGETPEAEFASKGKVTARAYCNLHGFWKGEG